VIDTDADRIDDDAREAVRTALDRIERERGVTAVLAVAHGSRAWGVPGPDSDYDVRAVVVRDDWRRYVHLDDPADSFRAAFDAADVGREVEVEAWDVLTFARLLRESNDGAIDLLRSPVVYRDRVGRDALRAYALTDAVPAFARRVDPPERPVYDPIALYHAWRSIARRNYRSYLSAHLVDGDDRTYPILAADGDGYRVRTPDGDDVRVARDDDRFVETATRPTVKRNLVVLRAAASARYLLATGAAGAHELPAIDFPTFLGGQAPGTVDPEAIAAARDLVARKRAGDGDRDVGDRVGRAFAHPPTDVDPAVHARGRVAARHVDAVVDELLDAAGG
jgi:predicted nucleotidyltransferase